MKVHKIVFKHTGENADTAKDPCSTLDKFDGDLSEKKTCCVNAGWDALVSVDLYAVGEVELPDWLDPEDWIYNMVAWKWLWGMGAPKDWPEEWQRGLVHLPQDQKFAAIKLLKVRNFRSAFRKSLRDQMVAWLETPSDDRKYGSPLSPRQWGAMIDRYTARAAWQRGEALYRAR